MGYRDQRREGHDQSATEHGAHAARHRSHSALDQSAGDPATGEAAEIGGQKNDPRDAQILLRHVACAEEIFRKPKLKIR